MLGRRALTTRITCTAGGIGGVAFPLIILCLASQVGFPRAIRTIGAAIDLKALREAKFGLATLAVILIEFAVFIPYAYICSYAIHEGIDLQKSPVLSALLNAGAIPGRALPRYVADRFGPFNFMYTAALVFSTFILALWMTVHG
ncbi:hypothetical protein CORC01_03503 [Colletotrichum orchidophilum]|uniref:Major facilitator superfamily transporter n=1 Tax=Colletotrichum orchidophilum TaxID=1209926 RepID=A0A1G4BIR7_9PEZI|nr:uncharacterized protein CORC01_03503 [Colletotrichum orchidophilum]OHF01188.1 hypothetical protein CORC01_03503 [Colletotrichum orchidophilum]